MLIIGLFGALLFWTITSAKEIRMYNTPGSDICQGDYVACFDVEINECCLRPRVGPEAHSALMFKKQDEAYAFYFDAYQTGRGDDAIKICRNAVYAAQGYDAKGWQCLWVYKTETKRQTNDTAQRHTFKGFMYFGRAQLPNYEKMSPEKRDGQCKRSREPEAAYIDSHGGHMYNLNAMPEDVKDDFMESFYTHKHHRTETRFAEFAKFKMKAPT